jgi:hippurate hydrolase
MKFSVFAAALGFASLGGIASAAPALKSDIATDYSTHLEELFIHFHKNPELSFREVETSKRLAAELEALGLEVTTGVGKTGIVSVLENGEGPVIMIRADMDGLPLAERSGLAYASKATQTDIDGKEKPVMHACGHDTHMTSLVGTARQLIARKDQWSGTLVFIGQPAEERISGARAMIEDGLYTRFPKPEYALAFHVGAGLELGKISLNSGPVYSGSDSVDIKVHGVGAHGASPHKGIDPVLIASQIVVSLQSLVARSIDPLQPGVVTVGSVHGGFKHNIIPEEVDLQLTVRSDSPDVRDTLMAGIERIAKGTAEALGVPADKLPEVSIHNGQSTPPTINDADATGQVRAALIAAMGEDAFSNSPKEGMGAEDFAEFVTPEHGVKGVYFAVGGTPASELKTTASHHSPEFRITPGPVIRTATEAMTLAVLELADKADK